MLLPFRITPILWGLIAVAGMGFLYWVADGIGDIRESKVHARYAAAAELTNEHVAAFTSEDEKVAAVSEALRLKALSAAQAVQGDKHPASKEQAEALNRIR